MNAEKLAGALDGGRQSGPRWLARCLAHDDRTPSLSIAATADPLEVFIARAETRAYLMSQGELDLHDAVDVLQTAAVQTGLVGALGQDAVQAIMAKAFAAVRKPQIVEPVADVVLDPPPEPEPEPGPRAAESTVEAFVYALRQRGAAALAERACQSRLAELSTAQIRNVIERLIVARPRFPVIDDELLFLLSEQLA